MHFGFKYSYVLFTLEDPDSWVEGSEHDDNYIVLKIKLVT